nr:PREDICTED: cytochrome P450 2G1-like [Paralichthys olivaceus]
MYFTITVILAGLILALLLVLTVKSSKKYNLPPGPVALPLVGNLPQLDRNAPFKSFLKFGETYGPVMTFYLGRQRTVVLVGYDAVKEALVDQADDFMGRGPLPFLIKATKGYGLGVSNGERWRQLVRFTLSTLRNFGMGRKGMEEWIQEESKHLRGRIDSFKAAQFDPTVLVMCTVSNVICCMVFGQRFSYEDKQFLYLLNIVFDFLTFASSPLGQMYNMFPSLMDLLPGYHQTVFDRAEGVREFIEMKILEHKETLDPSSPRDFIDSFLIRTDQVRKNFRIIRFLPLCLQRDNKWVRQQVVFESERRRGPVHRHVMDVTVVLAVGLVLSVLWLLSLRSRAQVRLPPGPSGLPLIGNLLQLDKRAPFKTMCKLSESYGPVMTVYLGRQRIVVLVGYDTVKEALVDQADDFTGRGQIPFLFRATKGYGLVISNGERWRQLRRFTLTTLRDFGMGRKGMEEWIQEESSHLVARFNSLKDTSFDPTFYLSCTVSNVICCLVFGQRFSYDDEEFLYLLQTISEVLKFGSSPFGQLYNVFPRLMELLPGRQHTLFARIDELRKFIMRKIQEHEDTLDTSSPRDYIDCFLLRLSQEKNDPTSEFHYENLVSTVLNLYLAGTETTSSTIRFALSVFIKYPKVQERMQQEIDTVIGQHRYPHMEDRKSLPFTDAVLHEIQRLLDIVPMNVPHYALQDISFRGYTIPKNTLIIPLLHSVLKEEKQWATPWSFNPQHFLDQNGNLKKNPAFMPFSAGKRSCVGESLARMELFLFLVSLLQHFTFSCSGGPDSVDLSPEYSSFANLPRTYNIIATPRLS